MLAIVIPYFKLAFFDESLQSLANQTNKNFKVYIGDDASVENPNVLLQKYKNKFEFIYHRFESNLGSTSLVKQWERCIDLVEEEEWVMLLGDDDYLGSNVVAEFYSNYSKFENSSNLIRFSSVVIDAQNNKTSTVFQHPILETGIDSYCRKVRGKTRSSLSEYIFRKGIYMKKKFVDYPLAFYSDDRAWLDFSDNKPIYSINNATIYIRISTISISGKEDNILLKTQAEIDFFTYLFYHKLSDFAKSCKLVIMHKFENAILKKRRLKLSEFIYLYYHYLLNYNYKLFMKFNKRFIRRLFYK